MELEAPEKPRRDRAQVGSKAAAQVLLTTCSIERWRLRMFCPYRNGRIAAAFLPNKRATPKADFPTEIRVWHPRLSRRRRRSLGNPSALGKVQ